MDINSIFRSCPSILEKIFSNLDARDIGSCAMVCSIWNRIAEDYKLEQRLGLLGFFEPAFLNVKGSASSDSKQRQTRCCEARLTRGFKNSCLQGRFALIFTSVNTIDNFKKLFPRFQYDKNPWTSYRLESEERKEEYLKAVLHTAVKQYLPKNCDVVLCLSESIFNNRLTCDGDTEGDGFSGFLLPKFRGHEIHSFDIREEHWEVDKKIPDLSSIKCLLVFLTPMSKKYINKVVENGLINESSKLAVGGCIIDGTESVLGTVVAFCGPKVHAASIIIDLNDTKEEVVKKLQSFKTCGVYKNLHFAFMFSTLFTSIQFHRDHPVPSQIFHSVYPYTSLFRLFGSGQVGMDYLLDVPTERKFCMTSMTDTPELFLREYATVFVMIYLEA